MKLHSTKFKLAMQRYLKIFQVEVLILILLSFFLSFFLSVMQSRRAEPLQSLFKQNDVLITFQAIRSFKPRQVKVGVVRLSLNG